MPAVCNVIGPVVPDDVRQCLRQHPQVKFAVLIGSRADATSRPDSDWDIAVFTEPALSPLDKLALLSDLQCELAQVMGTAPEKIDLVDLNRAGLTMREVVANKGIPLTGDDSAPWFVFLQRTWRELEYLQWERDYAA
jgi:predicted nucleotidyltransferase